METSLLSLLAGTALIASVDGANASESPVLSENQMDQVTAGYTYYSGNGATFNGSVWTFTPISSTGSLVLVISEIPLLP